MSWMSCPCKEAEILAGLLDVCVVSLLGVASTLS